MNVDTTLALSAGIVSLGLFISTLEFLILRKEFGKYGVFGYQIFTIQTAGRPFERMQNFVNRPPNFIYGVLLIRLICTVITLIYAFVFLELQPVVLILLCITTWFINLRCRVGLDGSDAMSFIIISILTASSFFQQGDIVRTASVIFVGGQVIWSYVAAGIFKAISPTWKKGLAVEKIFSVSTYGTEWATLFLQKNKIVSIILNWSVIIGECCFFLILFCPQEYTIFFLSLGIIFHIATAIIMGLNGFLWAFVSGYPAIIWLNNWILEFYDL